MRSISLLSLGLATIILLFISVSCKSVNGDEGGLEDSLDPVEEVIPVTGAENSTITVNKSNDTYFTLEFENIGSNDVIENGMTGEGWCIDWQMPIDSDNSVYSNISLYSTFQVEKWKRVNFLFNIVDHLQSQDPDITFREIQLVVWSLRGYPEFNLEELEVEDLPSRMVTDGEPNFSYDKVDNILQIVEAGYEDFDYTEGTRYAVIAETPADVQTVITVVE